MNAERALRRAQVGDLEMALRLAKTDLRALRDALHRLQAAARKVDRNRDLALSSGAVLQDALEALHEALTERA